MHEGKQRCPGIIQAAWQQQATAAGEVIHKPGRQRWVGRLAAVVDSLGNPRADLILVRQDLASVVVVILGGLPLQLHLKGHVSQPRSHTVQRSGRQFELALRLNRLQIRLGDLVVEQRPAIGKSCPHTVDQGHHRQQIGRAGQAVRRGMFPDGCGKFFRGSLRLIIIVFTLGKPVSSELVDLGIGERDDVDGCGEMLLPRDLSPNLLRHFAQQINEIAVVVHAQRTGSHVLSCKAVERNRVVPHDSRCQHPATVRVGRTRGPELFTQSIAHVNTSDLVEPIEQDQSLPRVQNARQVLPRESLGPERLSAELIEQVVERDVFADAIIAQSDGQRNHETAALQSQQCCQVGDQRRLSRAGIAQHDEPSVFVEQFLNAMPLGFLGLIRRDRPRPEIQGHVQTLDPRVLHVLQTGVPHKSHVPKPRKQIRHVPMPQLMIPDINKPGHVRLRLRTVGMDTYHGQRLRSWTY